MKELGFLDKELWWSRVSFWEKSDKISIKFFGICLMMCFDGLAPRGLTKMPLLNFKSELEIDQKSQIIGPLRRSTIAVALWKRTSGNWAFTAMRHNCGALFGMTRQNHEILLEWDNWEKGLLHDAGLSWRATGIWQLWISPSPRCAKCPSGTLST